MGSNGTHDPDDPFAAAVNLESQCVTFSSRVCSSLTRRRFYDQGYAEGLAHGRLHGTFEGRALGKEKGFEIWEEVGYYEGWAEMWSGLLGQADQGKEAK